MAWRLDVVPGSVPGSQAVGDPAPSGASTILAEAPVIIRQKLTNVFTIPNDRQKVNIFPGGLRRQAQEKYGLHTLQDIL